MKKLSILIILFSAIFLNASAQYMNIHLHGTVTRDSTNAPVVNHEVFIQADSNSAGYIFYASRFTNPNGYYDCSINDVPIGVPITFIVKTKNCDSLFIVKSFQNTNTEVEENFVLCNDTVYCNAHYHYMADYNHPLHVHFWDSEMPEGTVISYMWNFGDGTTSENADPWHVYTQAGSYNVCLSIATIYGTTCQYCDSIQVGENNYMNIDLYGTVTRDSTEDPVPNHKVVILSDSNSAGFYFYAIRYTDPNGYYHCPIPDVPVNALITFEVKTPNCDSLFIIKTFQNTDTTVEENFIICNDTVSCDAHYHYMADYNNLLHVHFWPTGMAPGLMVSHLWNFGDGTTSDNFDPWHVYAQPGIYNVCLSIATIYGTTCQYCDSITIGGNPQTYDVDGTVLVDSLYADHAKVFLIRLDSLNSMTIIDSVEVSNCGGHYHFGGVPAGFYFTQGWLLPASAYFGQYVPTYHLDAIYWPDADTIITGLKCSQYDIVMQSTNHYSQGNGTIEGTVSEGTKISSGGTPSPGVEVLILSTDNTPLGYTVTGSDGSFKFAGVTEGSYKIYPEYPGKITVPAAITLDAQNTSADIHFVIKGNKIGLGIDDHLSNDISSISSIYPNPAGGKASVMIRTSKAIKISLEICSVSGAAMKQTGYDLAAGDNLISWDNSSFPEGVYFIRIKDNSGTSLARKFVVGR